MKDLLESYNIYKSEIKYREYEIRKLELEEASPSSSNISINGDIRSNGYVSSNLENKAINNIDKIKKLKLEINELKAKIEMIDSIVNILKCLEKDVISLYYFDKKTIKDISLIIEREEQTVNIIKSRAILKMVKYIKNRSD